MEIVANNIAEQKNLYIDIWIALMMVYGNTIVFFIIIIESQYPEISPGVFINI